MNFYFIIFAILSLFSFVEIFGLKSKQQIIIFLLFTFCMFILSFLRWEVGTDWISYFSFFDSSNQWMIESEFEWGFSRLNEFVKIIFDNYTILLFILGTILFGFQTKAIYKLSPYPITSLLFLWSISFGNVMFVRQTVATSILLFSVNYIINQKFRKFIFCIGLAMLFHRTSLIFLPAWWIYKIKIKPLWLWTGIGISVLFTIVIKSLLDNLIGIMGPIIQYKLDVYLSDSETTFGTNATLGQIIIKGVINKLIIFAILLYMSKKVIIKYPIFQRLINLYWIGILLYFSTISISVAFVRLSFAYDILQIILVPILFSIIKNYQLKIICFIILLTYLSLRLYVALVSNYYDMYVPFKTIFNN